MSFLSFYQPSNMLLQHLASTQSVSISSSSTNCGAHSRWTSVGGHVCKRKYLSATWCPANLADEPTVFTTRALVEAILRREKGKAPQPFFLGSQTSLSDQHSCQDLPFSVLSSKIWWSSRQIQESMLFVFLISWVPLPMIPLGILQVFDRIVVHLIH